MNIAEQYVNGLKEAYYNNGLQEEWDQFEQVKQGASPEDVQNLLACYPDIPQSLLHFSDCMNNGGTSQLFIDFSPSPAGKKGQILRYLHDPGELAVIAGSFDEYLQMLMEAGYDFIKNEELED